MGLTTTGLLFSNGGKTSFFLVLMVHGSTARAIVDNLPSIVSSSSDDRFIRSHTVRLVSVNEDGSDRFICSGATTGPLEVVGAAHCIRGMADDLKNARVFAEVYDESAPRRRRRVQVETAESRNDSEADLGYVRLRGEPIQNTSLPLASKSSDCRDGKRIVAGFGTTETGDDTLMVRRATYTVANPDQQKEVIRRYEGSGSNETLKRLETTKMSFLLPVKGQACFGDSGGPVFCHSRGGRLVLAGIVGSFAVKSHWLKKFSGRDEKICRQQDVSLATPASVISDAISKWRQGPTHEATGTQSESPDTSSSDAMK